MQVMIRTGMTWRVSQNHNIKRFNRFKRISYQGDKLMSMGKTYQKSDDGRKREASNERVRRGLEKCPARNRTGSTLRVRGSLTEVKRKISVTMARNRLCHHKDRIIQARILDPRLAEIDECGNYISQIYEQMHLPHFSSALHIENNMSFRERIK
jgi:hypothetical protein